MSLTDRCSLAQAINETVCLSAYDAQWPALFSRERQRLLSICPNQFVAIEHIGSTAVPGMSAKPVVDIMAAVASMNVADSMLERLCESGYVTSAQYNATLGERRWLMRWENGHRTHHLHLVLPDSKAWHEHLAFRDALRSEPALAAEYLALKRALAARHASDRQAYSDAKRSFIRQALRG